MATFTFATGTVRTTSFDDSTPGSNKITVAADAFINVEDNWTAIGLQGSGVWDVKVDGGIYASHDPSEPGEGRGLGFQNFASTTNSKVTVGLEGSIGGFRQGIVSDVAIDVTNAGRIAGGREAISFNGFHGPNGNDDGSESNLNVAGKQVKVDNKATGEIVSDFLGISNNSYATMTVLNAGDILGGYSVDWDDEWRGAAINSDKGALKLTNTGNVEGGVSTGWFGNTITNKNVIDGTIQGYLNRNDAGFIDLDHDGDFEDVASGGAVHTDNLVPIVSTINNSGVIRGTGDFGRNDNDTPDNPDDDEFFQVAMSLSRGKEVVTNSGQIFGDVWLNRGDDTLTNKGKIKGYVDGGRGHDNITNSGTIEYGVGGGDGNDTLTNSGFINGWVDLGDGTNTTTNKGTIREGMGGNDGADTIVNSGLIDGDITTHGGADKLTNTGTINGDIYLGEGADQFKGGKQGERIFDEGGADSYLMGDGEDTIFVSNDHAADVFDGGISPAQTRDKLDLRGVDVGVTLNLAVQTLLIAGTTDTVKGFERIIATDHADVIIGSNLGERIRGEGGSDTITGGGGNDRINGGDGADTFVFTALNDSGKTRATRDVILDFNSDEDLIRILFDANTTGGGAGDDFTALLNNTTFTSHAGELRYIWRAEQTIVEGDVNGDGKADFSIALEGQLNLNLSDFMFS